MREIKFRAWDITNSVMIPASELSFHEFVTIQEQFGDDEKWFMQFTGTKDFFGTDIYDLDIVFLDSKMMIGTIINDGISWRIEFEEYGLEWLCDYYESLHVIGNIYETPELLK